MLAAVAALAVAAAVGGYFAAQIGDGTTVAQEAEQGRPAVTPTAPAVLKPSVTPLPPSPTPHAPTSLLTTTATPLPPSPTPPAPTPLLTTTATPTLTPVSPEPTIDTTPTPTPESGRPVPPRDLPTASAIQLGPDGKYFIPDRGDGCTWVEEGGRLVDPGSRWVFLHSSCYADFFLTFDPRTGEVHPAAP